MNILRCFSACVALTCLCTPLAWGQSEATTWTNSAGKTIEAEFVRLNEDGVVLKLKADGREAEVPFSALSLESHLQAIKLGHPEEFSKPLVKAVIEPLFEIPPPRSFDVDALLQTPFSETQSLEEFITVAQAEFNSGNYFVLWHMLPEPMQADLAKLGARGMEKVGSAPIVQIKTLLKQLNTVVTEKEEFVFGYPDIAGSKAEKREMATMWPILKQVVQSLSDESLWEKENFQEENFERWLAQLLGALGSNHDAFLALADHQSNGLVSSSLNRMASVAASTPEAGQIEINLPLPMQGNKVTFNKFGDVWVAPAMMKPLRAAVDKGLAEMDSVDETQVKQVLQTSLGTVIPIVSALARAKTQEDFNAVVDELKPYYEQVAQRVPPMGGPMPGGPGAPGPGGRQPSGNRNFGAPGVGGPGDGGGAGGGGRRNFGAPGVGGPGSPNG